ncbi:O-Methyltransferase involved in polyketide biosynthesis [Amycolatopsis marina]|uniref:O-Methyltransferase involved in polyketide biosynthesis n=1 Tax=Amycolatopsis marina TaxID=490629 RepID=A0A1I1BHY6_9PSEU|nr:class I SAM-dependent methyltransferase [Amycolatopsis marina]SFB49767.1 O-Methyltransferase involved in polyketide biosynthesis [Amycolatopsis marina]
MKTYSIDHLTPVQKTLLVTLKGRVLDSRSNNPILRDPLVTDIARRLDYDIDTVKLSLGVPEAIAIRTSILDRAVDAFVRTHPDAVVVELGSGLETRMFRLAPPATVDWYDVDLPEVIELRDELMPHRENAHSVGTSLLDPGWTDTIPSDRPTIVVGDGILGFLGEEQNKQVLTRITDHFTGGELVFNAYTKIAARMTGRYTSSVGMPKEFRGFGFNDPHDVVAMNPRLTFVDEQTGAAAPESEQLNGLYRLLARWFARWPAQARRGVWVVRYRF